MAVLRTEFVVQLAQCPACPVAQLPHPYLFAVDLMQHDLLAGHVVVQLWFVGGHQQAHFVAVGKQLADFFLQVRIVQAVVDIFVLLRGDEPGAPAARVLFQLSEFVEIPIQLVIGKEKLQFSGDGVPKLAPVKSEKHAQIRCHREKQRGVIPFAQIVHAVGKRRGALLCLRPIMLLDDIDALGVGVFLDQAVQQPEQVVHVWHFTVGIEAACTVQTRRIGILPVFDAFFQARQMKKDVAHQVKVDHTRVDIAF